MRIHICAVGRLRGGPEAALIDDYVTRFDRIGRNLSLGPCKVIEVEARKGGQAEEAQLLLKALPPRAKVIALDERGKLLPSPDFAQKLARWRDDGAQDVALIIGGADGLTQDVRNRADLLLSFGAMVWPHMLVRVMVSEQLYRAASILSGSPYHRT